MRDRLRFSTAARAAAACLCAIQLAGCSSVDDESTAPVEYVAYGKTWQYFAVEHYIREWGFGSTHGIFGLKERVTQDVYLVAQSGEKIGVVGRIVALQKDGSYRAMPCCGSFSTHAKIYNFEGKLILTFAQTRDKTTDCRIYPPGRPDDETAPPEHQVRYAILFGEFDRKVGVFRMRDFFPDAPESESKKLGVNPSFEQIDEFFYSWRKPFEC